MDAFQPPPAVPPAYLAGPGFLSIDALMNHLNDWARVNGLGFVKIQASNKVAATGQYMRYTVACGRCRGTRPSEARIRVTTTAKTNCPWRAVATARAPARLWFITKFFNTTHNHPASSTAASHTCHQVLSPEMHNVLHAQLQIPTIRTADIFTTLQLAFPDRKHTISLKKIQNLRQKMQREKQNGLQQQQQPSDSGVKRLQGEAEPA